VERFQTRLREVRQEDIFKVVTTLRILKVNTTVTIFKVLTTLTILKVVLMVSIVEATTVKKPEAVTIAKMYKEVPLRMNILLQQYRQERPSVVRSDRVLYRQDSTVTILRSCFKVVSPLQEQLWRITLKVLIAIQHCFKVATVVRQGGYRVQWE